MWTVGRDDPDTFFQVYVQLSFFNLMLEKLLQIALDSWRFLCKVIQLEQTYVTHLSFSDISQTIKFESFPPCAYMVLTWWKIRELNCPTSAYHIYDICVHYLVNFVRLLRNMSFGRAVVHVPINV